MRLDHTTEVPEYLWEAARVSRIMCDEELGRWKLQSFTVTPEKHALSRLKIETSAGNREIAAVELSRLVPPGDYISLMRRMTQEEKEEAVADQIGMPIVHLVMAEKGWTFEQALDHFAPPEKAYIPIMSDTPAEILEHDHALNNATGVVVITGLGLGCLPHALLEKPEVTEIHVIEIDPEVIALTGKYLDDPRVTIHQGSATDVRSILPAGMRVDYAWHDIWSHISSRNFDPATAEHGIAYSTLFELYADHLDVGDTAAWAYREALIQKGIIERESAAELEFRRQLRTLPLDDAVELAYQRIMRGRFKGVPDDFEIPDDFMQLLDPGYRFKAHLYTTLGDPEFWAKFDAEPDGPSRPLGFPNAHLEAP